MIKNVLTVLVNNLPYIHYDYKGILIFDFAFSDCESPSKTKLKREICSFKELCYRKNPHHFKEYDHPHCTNIFCKFKRII